MLLETACNRTKPQTVPVAESSRPFQMKGENGKPSDIQQMLWSRVVTIITWLLLWDNPPRKQRAWQCCCNEVSEARTGRREEMA